MSTYLTQCQNIRRMEPHANTDLHIQANICERHWQYLFNHCRLTDGHGCHENFLPVGFFSKLASAPIRQARSSDDDRTYLRADKVVFHWRLHA